MKVSELWLREWVNPPLKRKRLAERLTQAGIEIEALIPVASSFKGVVVAEVIKIESHPKADKLTLCHVDPGDGNHLQIVCGATNVRAGLKVALAKCNAVLGDKTIHETCLRGELSQGMLCSANELGLIEQSEGILELDTRAVPGMDLRTYLNLDDVIFDVNLTPNRADCFSVYGLAREIAALTQVPIKPLFTEKIQARSEEKIPIQIDCPAACPHYAGRIISNINPTTRSPAWLVERLTRGGIRPIHPVVDVTNYVLLELGQPMHAFDLAKINKSICVRFAKNDDVLKLLDANEINLTERNLVIADQEKPLALAGIMGGNESAVTTETRDIFIESAFFDPLTIATSARDYHLCTDSSQRFERGVDPNLQRVALERATALLIDVVGGTPGPCLLISQDAALPPSMHRVLFNPAKVKQITGLSITKNAMITILTAFGMKVNENYKGENHECWEVMIPAYRFDIRLDVDLVEEIARHHGYDKLIGSKMQANMQVGHIHPLEALAKRLSQWLMARGYHETISYSFVDPVLQNRLYPNTATLQLVNPISAELAQMRLSLWPGLLTSLIYNINRKQSAVKLFEIGVIFKQEQDHIHEQNWLAGLLWGEHGALNWSEKAAKYDFYDAKGDLEALFSLLQIKKLRFSSTSHPALHPGKSARIHIDEINLGCCGILHPAIADRLAINGEEDVVLFELNLAQLITSTVVQYQAISKFPPIRRDLSFLVDQTVTAGEIEEAVRSVVLTDQLKSFDLFDHYTAATLPHGKKSLAIALTLQDFKKTLIDHEINSIIDGIINKLINQFDIILRD